MAESSTGVPCPHLGQVVLIRDGLNSKRQILWHRLTQDHTMIDLMPCHVMNLSHLSVFFVVNCVCHMSFALQEETYLPEGIEYTLHFHKSWAFLRDTITNKSKWIKELQQLKAMTDEDRAWPSKQRERGVESRMHPVCLCCGLLSLGIRWMCY